MSNKNFGFGTQIRKSPYFDATVRWGATGFSVYNHMYMPTSYGDSVAEYQALTERVSIWDVAVERQVEIVGSGALELVDYLSTRGMRSCKEGRSRYTPICDHTGILINDCLLYTSPSPRD